MSKEPKWTPEHFPRGTVIKTCLYRINSEGKYETYFGIDESQSVEFTIDHVKVVSTWSGRNIILVTTTKKFKPLYDGDDVMMFNVSHVTCIKSLGKQLVIRYDETEVPYSVYCKFQNGKPIVPSFYLKLVLLHYVERINQSKEFNLSEMVNSLIKCGVFKRITDYDYTFNKKKLKRWLKQNLNRFIFTQKELQKFRDEFDAELYKDLESGFDRDYDDIHTLRDDDETPFEDREMMNVEEKACHDGLYGGCTEADFA